MSSWAEIESIAETLASPVAGAARATEGVHVVVSRPIGRLRRQHRPVLGSIDSAGAMLQHNGRAVIVGSAFILVPGLVLTVVGAALTYDRFSSLSSSMRTVPELFGLGGAAVGVERVVWFLSIVFQSLAASCVGGYVATLVVQRQVGTEVSAKAAFRPFIRRLPALCVAWFFGHIWVFPILWLISRVAQPAAIVVLGAPIAVCMLALTLLVAPSVAIEGLGPFHGLRRGWQLLLLPDAFL